MLVLSVKDGLTLAEPMNISPETEDPMSTVSGVRETIRHSAGGDTTSIPKPEPRELDLDDSDELTDAMPPAGVNPETGDRTGQYVLQEKLGAGVSCFVFRGWDEKNLCPVALKIINWSNVYDHAAAMKQMRTEAAALARVKHPRVVRFIDFGFDPRWPFLVTEYVEGRTMGELIRGNPLPVEWACYLISQVVDGLGAVWRAGVVHRDIKPDNVLIGPNGVAKLIDFGLAKAPVQAGKPPSGPELAGTASYLAPEQAKDASVVDLRADIYSLGVTFYEALTGHLPFESKNRMQMIFHHLNTMPVPPMEKVPEIPQIISDVCMWMLAKSPEERPQNYDDLRNAFDTIMGQ
jgi:serine/threonine protein kinase